MGKEVGQYRQEYAQQDQKELNWREPRKERKRQNESWIRFQLQIQLSPLYVQRDWLDAW
jgi:hypothetical protein